MPDREGARTANYVIPHVIYSDAYYSETVPYADLILPDTTYLERWDAISHARPPDRQRAWRRRCDPPAGGHARPRRAAVPGRADRARRAARPAGLHQGGRHAAKFKDYPDYIVNHQRAPGVGPLAGLRGADGTKKGVGEPNPDQLQRYIDNGCFWRDHLPPEQRYFKHANQAYLDNAQGHGLHRQGRADRHAALVGAAAEIPPRRARAMARGSRPIACASASRTYSTRCPSGMRRSNSRAPTSTRFDLSAVTQRPMAMYHSWGSMNAWLRQIHGSNKLYMARAQGRGAGARRTTTGSGSRAAPAS